MSCRLLALCGLSIQGQYQQHTSQKFCQVRPKRSVASGFTLIEMLVVILIIGILSAIATPSYLSWVSNRKVEDALATVVGALKEAQQEAARQSRGCTVTINPANNTISAAFTSPPTPPTPSSENCLPTGVRDLNTIRDTFQINTNFDGANPLQFTYLNTTPNSGLVVLSLPGASRRRCAVVSAGIGIIRTGYYTTDPTVTLAENRCSRTP